ncbi:trafficking protein Mon1-domain-containing protein [Melanogaster broomeanus]|nr:trafficking protein Mon1-domain-containing protein [Melanogaster broomeanus]
MAQRPRPSLPTSSQQQASRAQHLHDVDAEVDTINSEETTAIGQIDDVAGEGSREALRDQLRRTLSLKEPSGPLKPREYFVLTDAGKPVFASRSAAEDSEAFSSTMGIVQALLSVFIDDGDKLRCINAGPLRITFLLRSPLYYPESVTRSHLDYLHLQILSIVTASQLRRIFERRTNFDLRRLLNGAEPFLFSLLKRLELDLAMGTSSLHCLQMDPGLRSRVADTLVPITKLKDTLYIILVARGQVVTLVRPKKHSIHPTDIHIIVNTIHSPSIFNSPAAASWIPVCLPKFNPTGFVNAYISFLRKPERKEADASNNDSGILEDGSDNAGDKAGAASQRSDTPLDAGIGLVCISGGGEFETVRGWCDAVAEKLDSHGLLDAISDTIDSGQAEYSVSQLGVPGLRHFVYKSRPHVQITFPVFEDPYNELEERRRIITTYQIVYDAIHAKSDQSEPLKLQCIRTEKEIIMGWITQLFELYITLSPRLPKTAVINAANAVTRWVKKEEGQLFLRDAPVF